MTYTMEKLWQTVSSLATPDLPLRDRLKNAYLSQFMRLREADFPPEERIRFNSIKKYMTGFAPDQSQDLVHDSSSFLNSEDMKGLAEKIVNLYHSMAIRYPTWEAGKE